tara:strand:+ start:114 stop:731 length:618 start_codon:yes stop_codon:yes gene_type:complete
MELIAERRHVDQDNSCLFSSIGYLMSPKEFNELTKYKYRQIIAEAIINNKSKYNAVFLGRSIDDYLSFIQNPDNWGGEIELKIFSDVYKIEIVNIQVETLKMFTYGSGEGYSNRIYVLYTGIHYDPLVMTLNNTSDDITIFSSFDLEIQNKFINLVKVFQSAKDFVNLSNVMKLQCTDCNSIFNTQDEATNHASTTNHWNYDEIH